MILREPLACEGFYATRLVARRAIRVLTITAMVVAALAAATAVVGFVLADSFLVYSWGVM